MIGKFLVKEGPFWGRFVCAKFVGETDKFWVLQKFRPDGTCDEIPERKVKKSSIGIHAVFDELEAAQNVARSITKRLSDENKRHEDSRRQILSEELGVQKEKV